MGQADQGYKRGNEYPEDAVESGLLNSQFCLPSQQMPFPLP